MELRCRLTWKAEAGDDACSSGLLRRVPGSGRRRNRCSRTRPWARKLTHNLESPLFARESWSMKDAREGLINGIYVWSRVETYKPPNGFMWLRAGRRWQVGGQNSFPALRSLLRTVSSKSQASDVRWQIWGSEHSRSVSKVFARMTQHILTIDLSKHPLSCAFNLYLILNNC